MLDDTWASLIHLDQDCRITEVNAAARALTEPAGGDRRGRRFCEVFAAVPCDQGDGPSCPFLRARRGTERRQHPRWVKIVVDGKESTVLLGVSSLPPSGARRAAVVTLIPESLIDNADRKRREMMTAAVHELRHPLAVQSITVDLLAGQAPRDLSPEGAMLMQRLQRATAYLTACVEELQNRMLFDLGTTKIQPHLLQLRPIVEQVVWQHDPLLQRRKQRVTVRLAADLMAWADPAALGHVLANVVINAHKHSSSGDTFVLTARRLPRRDQVEIRLRDHGPGVPATERRRVFDRFYRGAATRGQRGAGLGLAIVKSLVEQMGGTVGIAAPRGGGAVVWLRLPAMPPDSEAAPIAGALSLPNLDRAPQTH